MAMDPKSAVMKITGELRGPAAQAFMALTMNRIRSETIRNLTGKVLHVRSGRLRGSILTRTQVQGARLVGEIGTNVSYAGIWELTGSKAHTVRPVNAKALMIPLGKQRSAAGKPSNVIFRKWARIPVQKARPFMRPAIDVCRPWIEAQHAARFKTATDVNMVVMVKGKSGATG